MAFQKGMIRYSYRAGNRVHAQCPANRQCTRRRRSTASRPCTAVPAAAVHGGGGAQGGGGGGRGGGAPAYTPAAGARDLRSVLFNWGWHLGMLRGDQEIDLIASLEYQGKGTMQVDGQPCTLTKYRISTNYQTSGQRTQITCTRPNGQTYSNIEVLSGAYSWNEDIPGAELIKGKGKATPMAAATEERMIRLWASPQGALKSALAGIQDPPMFAVRPGTQVPADVATAGKTSVVWEGGKPVVSFPIPGCPHGNGDGNPRREVHGGTRCGPAWNEHHRVHLQRLSGLEQSAPPGRGVCRRQDDGTPEWYGRSRYHGDSVRSTFGTTILNFASLPDSVGGDSTKRIVNIVNAKYKDTVNISASDKYPPIHGFKKYVLGQKTTAMNGQHRLI